MFDRAITIIETIEYLTIASICPDNTPWNTPVFTNYDSDLNFYWGSDKSNVHSINIEKNNDIFCVIYDSRAPAGTGEGLYLKGIAEILDDQAEIDKALKILLKRSDHFGNDYQSYIDDKPRRIYKFIPHEAWLNDGTTKKGDYVDTRQALDLKTLKEKMKKESL